MPYFVAFVKKDFVPLPIKTYLLICQTNQKINKMACAMEILDDLENYKFIFKNEFPRFTNFLNLIDKTKESPEDLVVRIRKKKYFKIPKEIQFGFLNNNLSEEELLLLSGQVQFNGLIESDFAEYEEKNLISAILFRKDLTNALTYPTEKTKKAADNYYSWFKVCCALKFLFSGYSEEGEKEDWPEYDLEGFQFFKTFSQLSSKYDKKECFAFWKKCQPKFGAIHLIFSMIDRSSPPLVLDRKKIILSKRGNGEK